MYWRCGVGEMTWPDAYEDRACREIDRAREESKALGAQLKDAQSRLNVAQRSAAEHQLTLADAREQLQVARSQAQLVVAQLEQSQQNARDAGEQISSLQSALEAARADLSAARERAVEAEARAQALADRTNPVVKKRR